MSGIGGKIFEMKGKSRMTMLASISLCPPTSLSVSLSHTIFLSLRLGCSLAFFNVAAALFFFSLASSLSSYYPFILFFLLLTCS